jgi:toxin-antitoxin system PIN domain toxin
VKIVDANVLIYAVNQDSPHHPEARDWLNSALSPGHATSEPIGLAWLVLLAFWRITTHSSIFPSPLPVATAGQIIEAWITQPAALIVTPTPRHLALLTGLLATSGAGANLVNDAHLAALALEHGATLVSYDRDLTRFAGLRVEVPGV